MRATNMQLSFLGLEGFSVSACPVQTLPLVWRHARNAREGFTFRHCLHMNRPVVVFGPLYRRKAFRTLHPLRIIYLPPVCMFHDWWKQQKLFLPRKLVPLRCCRMRLPCSLPTEKISFLWESLSRSNMTSEPMI